MWLKNDVLVIIQLQEPNEFHRFCGFKYLNGPHQMDGAERTSRCSLVATGRKPGHDLLHMSECDKTLMAAGLISIMEFYNLDQWAYNSRCGTVTPSGKAIQNSAIIGQVSPIFESS